MNRTSPKPPSTSPNGALGLSTIAIVALALLAAPRVVLHDLEVISEGTWVNTLLVFVPPLVWIVVALWRQVPNPFRTLLAVGLVYGVLLAAGHQALWHVSFADDPPRLGGNLADLDPGLQSVIMRAFSVVSSIVTGTLVGAVSGLIAWALGAAARRSM